MVQVIHDHLQFWLVNRSKIALLGQVLAHQTIGILIGAALAARIRPTEIRQAAQSGIELFMPSKLPTIVSGDGLILIPIRNSINNPFQSRNTFNRIVLCLQGLERLHQMVFKQS